jgi:hypothetical protein
MNRYQIIVRADQCSYLLESRGLELVVVRRRMLVYEMVCCRDEVLLRAFSIQTTVIRMNIFRLFQLSGAHLCVPDCMTL